MDAPPAEPWDDHSSDQYLDYSLSETQSQRILLSYTQIPDL